MGRYQQENNINSSDVSILVVDDNEINLALTAEIIKDMGLMADTAVSPYIALEMLKNKEYDLLLFDHMMPEMNGIELLSEVRKMKDCPNSAKPCLMLTANDGDDLENEYKDAGFDGYIKKPVEISALKALLVKSLPPEKISINTLSFFDEGSLIIDGLNVAQGIDYSGSEKLYRSMLDIFYQTYEAKAAELKDHYEAKEWLKYVTAVHALKSSARIIGAESLSELARDLEEAGKQGNISFIDNNHDLLMDQYHIIKEKLADICHNSKSEHYDNDHNDNDHNDNDDSLLSVADSLTVKESLMTIRKAADEFDYDKLEAEFDKMKTYSLSGKEKELFEKLSYHFYNIDYDSIIETVTESLNQNTLQ